jgi:hypothetical protein
VQQDTCNPGHPVEPGGVRNERLQTLRGKIRGNLTCVDNSPKGHGFCLEICAG